MSFEIPRASGFTFQSSVHSAHLLRCLDEQRRSDALCDLTVAVENRSFRAHRAVLAACSDYFQSRIASDGAQGLVISLPEEVTVKGFEPLLEFAYTARLLFTKENILEIHNCATILGFHNLDKACFEFLIPKFFDSTRDARTVRRKVCCKQRLQWAQLGVGSAEDGNEGATVATRPQQMLSESVEIRCPIASLSAQLPEAVGQGEDEMEVQTDSVLKSSDSSTLQAVCGKEHFCLHSCGPQMPFSSPALSRREDEPPCLPCPSDDQEDTAEIDCNSTPETSSVCPSEATVATGCLSCVTPPHGGLSSVACRNTLDISCSELCASSAFEPACCALSSFEDLDAAEVSGSDGPAELNGSDTPTDVGPPEPPVVSPGEEAAGSERSSVEREVAEHLVKGFYSDLCPPQSGSLVLDPVAPSALDKATDFHWLKQLDLSSSTGDCPFLRDLAVEETQLPDGERASQQDNSPYVSSVNSADDSDFDTEGDSELYTNERAQEVQLPFPVEKISSLSRNDFQQLLKAQSLSREQLDFVHDVRRRCKNRMAAQRCRKRKLDCIQNLECEIDKLNSEKEKLLREQNQLRLCMEETLQSLSGLCQKVCAEGTVRPDQLQLLAKYSSLERLLSPSGSPAPPTGAGGPDHNGPVGFSVDFSAAEHLFADDGVVVSQQPVAPGCGSNDSTPRTAVCPDKVTHETVSVVDASPDRNGPCVRDTGSHASELK